MALVGERMRSHLRLPNRSLANSRGSLELNAHHGLIWLRVTNLCSELRGPSVKHGERRVCPHTGSSVDFAHSCK